MTISLIELRRQPHLSISAIKTFLQCPRKYNLQYIRHIPPAFRPVALPFGSAWHNAIGTWLANSAVGDEIGRDVVKHIFGEDLEREVATSRVPVLFDHEDDTVEKAIALGHRMVDAFLDAVPLPERVLGVETPFALEVDDVARGGILPVPLIGAVDAIVVEDGRPVVWELKTAAKRWSADQTEFDQQSTAYAQAMRVDGYAGVSAKLIITTKAAKPTVQIESVPRTRADERELAVTAASVLRAVEAGVDHPARGWQCRTCPWATECRD
jgi:CRISPR/Cas system-associated exonuclease Cas4 (RecB family)